MIPKHAPFFNSVLHWLIAGMVTRLRSISATTPLCVPPWMWLLIAAGCPAPTSATPRRRGGDRDARTALRRMLGAADQRIRRRGAVLRPTGPAPPHADPVVAPDPPPVEVATGIRSLPLTQDRADLPAWVQACRVAMKFHDMLHPLDWTHVAERPDDRPWPGPPPVPRACFVAAYLVKIHENKATMTTLREYLVDHPALVWVLGFPLVPDATATHGFAVDQTVPSRRQLGRVLRTLPNESLQVLLHGTIHRIMDDLSPVQRADFAQVVAGDTKHIIAWVKENNPKTFVEKRYDKTRQPVGDPDCKLGVKKKRNRTTPVEQGMTVADFPTPTAEGTPATNASVEVDAYWGYATGVVGTILPDHLGEVVLAERTRPFNESDISFFFPLMTQTEQVLGTRPPNGTFDAAFDAFYVHEYFHTAGGMAAVPLVANRGTKDRRFSADGVPLCKAGLAMSCLLTYMDRTTTLVPHERGKYGCPLQHPTPTAEACPRDDPHWERGGCTTTIATSVGARARIEVDRTSAAYKHFYRQRTVTERINSQAVELGIERPKLRNGLSITNQNTLIYILINLRAWHRMRARQTSPACPEVTPATLD